MATSHAVKVGKYKFGIMTYMGSEYEDGIVVRPNQPLTKGFFKALKLVQQAYKYYWAESSMHHRGYKGCPDDLTQVIALIREGQSLGILEPNERIEELIDEYENPQKYRQQTRKPERVKETGYVYLLQSSEGYYKIGRAKVLASRIESLGVKLPFPIELIHSIKSDDYIQLEKDLHAQFGGKRGRGEWFNLSPDDIEYIKGL